MKDINEIDFNKFDSIRDLLEFIYTERTAVNPRYSLRAFSNDLQIPVSSASLILNKKRNISNSMVIRLGSALNFSPEQIDRFLTIKNISKKTSIENKQITFQNISLDEFNLISQWHHFALLELLKILKYKWNPVTVSKMLGISLLNTKFSLERLCRIGLLKWDTSRKRLMDSSNGSISALPKSTNLAYKNLQVQFLNKAIDCVLNTPPERRDNTGMTMAINSKDLPRAKELIKDFRREFSKILESTNHKNTVYHLSINLFPLSESIKTKGDSPS